MSENTTTGGLVEDLRALLAEGEHADTCGSVLSPEAGYPCSCWKADLRTLLDAHASRTAEATCSHTWPCPVHSPASSSPEPGAVEALARLIAGLVGGRKWVELSYSDFARAVLTAGYLSPADVGRVVAAAKAEALLEAADEMSAVIADGDVAEVAAPVPGEVGRGACVERRDALYEEPAEWLREYAANLTAAGPERRTEPDEAQRAPEEQLLWDIFARPPEHQLLGTVCSCGEWSAGCGHDVTGQWADHLRSAQTAKPDEAVSGD